MNDGVWITLDQRIGHIFAADFSRRVASGREDGDSLLGIVSVGGEYVDCIVFEQPVGGAAHSFAPESSERGAGHLDDAALFGPFHHALRTLAQNRIAFGMRDDGGDSAIAQLGKTFCDLLRHAVVAQFNQHVVRAFDGVARGVGEQVLQVVVGKMEVAAQGERERIAYESLEVRDEALKIRAVIVIAIVGVGRGNLMSDAIGGGHAAHGDGDFPGLRSVVHFRKNVRVNVDHDCRNTSNLLRLCLDLI